MKLKYVFLFLVFLFTFDVFGSDQSVRGRILDAETQEPLAYANVAILGKSHGTVSNEEGYFVLDRVGIDANDVIVFSYMGYQSLRMSWAEMEASETIYLQAATLQLSEVQVLSKTMTAKDIVKMIEEKYEQNYPAQTIRREMFVHKYEKVPFSDKNKLEMKKSDFVGMDRATFDQMLAKMPREFVQYQDAMISLYSDDDDHKLVPIKAISMEEGSMEELTKEMEKNLSTFFADIQKTNQDEDIYYKFRTGIFAAKAEAGQDTDSLFLKNKKDSLNYHIPTEQVKGELMFLLKDYGQLEGKNWEFITERGKYEYELDYVTVFDDEMVYAISFIPNNRGLFEGQMFVSTTSYAVLQLDFAYAEGKNSENVHLLGFGHSMKFKKGRVIFEKGEQGYHLKYLYGQQHEIASIKRDFSVMKKQKRFLFDKELNEIKMKADLTFDINGSWEVLVMDSETINPQQFSKVVEPKTMKFKKEYAYSPEMWDNKTVIAPTTELKKYTRK